MMLRNTTNVVCMKNNIIKMATHAGDIDGLACAALVIRKYGYENVHVRFLSVIEAKETNETFDLACDLPKPKNCIRNIDHHLTNLKELKESGRYNPKYDIINVYSMSAADILYKFLRFDANDKISREIKNLANEADSGHLNKRYAILYMLTRWFQDDETILCELAELLAINGKRVIYHPRVKELFKHCEHALMETKNKIDSFILNHRENVGEFVVIDTRNRLPAKFARQLVKPLFDHGARVIAVIYKDVKHNLIATSFRVANAFPYELNVGHLAEKLGGGGGQRAAAVRANNERIIHQVIYEFKRLAKKFGAKFSYFDDF